MKSSQIKSVIVAFVLLAAFTITLASEPPKLEHNPFARPSTDDIQVTRNANSNNSQSIEELQLNATMVSESSRLVNVNGRVIRVGDDIFGYTLRRVYENRAVFIKNGKQTTIYVKPKLEEDYDSSVALQDAN